MRAIGARAALSLFFCLSAFQDATAQHMQTGQPEPSPFGFIRFCLLKPERCIPSADHVVKMNGARWAELEAVNSFVNGAIIPEEDGSIIRPWRDETQRGDCKDYALAKRSRLIEQGWPASALLIAIAEVPDMGMHAVLIVVTDRGDLVLDNLGTTIPDYRRLRYRWHKRMQPNNPQFWQRIISRLRSNPEPRLLLIFFWRFRPLSRSRSMAQAGATEPILSPPMRVTIAAAARLGSHTMIFARSPLPRPRQPLRGGYADLDRRIERALRDRVGSERNALRLTKRNGQARKFAIHPTPKPGSRMGYNSPTCGSLLQV